MSDTEQDAEATAAASVLEGQAAQSGEEHQEAVATDDPEAGAAKPEEPSGASEDERTRSQIRREQRQRQTAALKEKLQALQSRAPEQAKDIGPPPSEADFRDNPEAYDRAARVYDVRKAMAQERKEQSEADAKRSQEEQKALQAALWQEREDEGVEKYDDFREVAYSAPLSDTMTAAIMDADDGADLAYYLGKNPREAQAIMRMPAPKQVFALGQIAARISAPEPKTKSSAPPPINPVKPTAQAPVSLEDLAKKQDARGYMAMRNAELEKGM